MPQEMSSWSVARMLRAAATGSAVAGLAATIPAAFQNGEGGQTFSLVTWLIAALLAAVVTFVLLIPCGLLFGRMAASLNKLSTPSAVVVGGLTMACVAAALYATDSREVAGTVIPVTPRYLLGLAMMASPALVALVLFHLQYLRHVYRVEDAQET